MRVGRLTAAATSCLVLLGCSLGEKQEQADRVTDAVNATADLPYVEGTISAIYSVEITRDEAASIGPQLIPDQAEVRYQIQKDPSAALIGPVDESSEFPLVLFADETVYLRKPDAGDDARPWLEFSLDDMTEGNGELTETTFETGLANAVISVLDPRLLLDLASGPLAGSIEVLAPQELDGTPTTHYEANFDIPRIFTETRDDAYDDDRAEQMELFLSLLAIDDDVHPGEVWIADDGTIRRFEIELELDVDRFIKLRLAVAMTVDAGSSRDPELRFPEPIETVEVQTLVPLQRVAASTVEVDAALGALLDE